MTIQVVLFVRCLCKIKQSQLQDALRLAPELNYVLQDVLRLAPELNNVLQDA